MGPLDLPLSYTLEHVQDKYPITSSWSCLQTQTPFTHINPLSGSPEQTPRAKTHARTQIDTWPDSKDADMDSNTHAHARPHRLPMVHAQLHTDTVTGHVLMPNPVSDMCARERAHHLFPVLPLGWAGMCQKATEWD